jgi:hypothetical protein
MKGIPTSAGSASRRENEFLAGGGHAKTSGEPASSFFAFFAASLLRVPGRCRALEKGADVGVRVGEGVLSPLRGWLSWGDRTQRSRAGLSSDGPPGLGARLGKTRSCRSGSGSNPVLLREFSIPMPMPMPMRAAKTSLVKWDGADFRPVEAEGFRIGDGTSPWRLRGVAACPLRVPGRCRALETGADGGARVGRGSVAPPGLVFLGDGTQRSRAGLSSVGPPGLGGGNGVSPVLLTISS